VLFSGLVTIHEDWSGHNDRVFNHCRAVLSSLHSFSHFHSSSQSIRDVSTIMTSKSMK
jgi:hypothetical protein